MNTATIEFRGNYGSFKVNAKTGFVVEHLPDWDEIKANGPECLGYTDVVRVNLEERRKWYAEHGRELPEHQPDGDVLDVGFWDQDMAYCGPEFGWRKLFLSEDV